jgi:hypothetical protein
MWNIDGTTTDRGKLEYIVRWRIRYRLKQFRRMVRWQRKIGVHCTMLTYSVPTETGSPDGAMVRLLTEENWSTLYVDVSGTDWNRFSGCHNFPDIRTWYITNTSGQQANKWAELTIIKTLGNLLCFSCCTSTPFSSLFVWPSESHF